MLRCMEIWNRVLHRIAKLFIWHKQNQPKTIKIPRKVWSQYAHILATDLKSQSLSIQLTKHRSFGSVCLTFFSPVHFYAAAQLFFHVELLAVIVSAHLVNYHPESIGDFGRYDCVCVCRVRACSQRTNQLSTKPNVNRIQLNGAIQYSWRIYKLSFDT